MIDWRRGDCRQILPRLAAGSVAACVTSPPYWRLRDYGSAAQIGQEATPQDYVAALVETFDLVRRVLRPDGVLWLQLGDSFAAAGHGGGGTVARRRRQWDAIARRTGFRMPPAGFKMKDLTLTPFALAAALRAQGWYLRQVIIWDKGRAQEPARLDRPATAHEYLFLLTGARDACVRDPGEAWFRRSIWSVPADAGGRGHPAAMPLELARRCIVSSSAPGEIILDPFAGSGTTAIAARRVGRRAIAIELSADYERLARARATDMRGVSDHGEA